MTFLLNAETIKNNILIVSPSTTRINNKLYRRISVGSKNTPEFRKRLANAILLVSKISINQSYLRNYIELENNIPSLNVKPKEINDLACCFLSNCRMMIAPARLNVVMKITKIKIR